MLSEHPFTLLNFFLFCKTTYASQIKFSRLAQVEDKLARERDILVYPALLVTRLGKISPFGLLLVAVGQIFFQKSSPRKWLLYGLLYKMVRILQF